MACSHSHQIATTCLSEASVRLDTRLRAPTLKLVAIDDAESHLEFLTESLRRDGLAIFTETDPEKGLELVYREHPQIVLLDLVMPKLNGLDVLERIMEFDSSIEVILMTAYYSAETAVEAIQKGASDYLNKPVPTALLRSQVERLLIDARRRERAMELDGELLDTFRFQGMNRPQPYYVGPICADPPRGASLPLRSHHRSDGNRKRFGGAGAA